VKGLLAVVVVLGLAAPAGATEWIICTSGDGAATASVLVGMVDVLSISRAHIEAGDKTWATDADGAARIRIGQAFEDSDNILVDFTDDQVSTIVASLRLFKATEGDNDVVGGILKVPGVGAWSVGCS
jgi:hypothetical protein